MIRSFRDKALRAYVREGGRCPATLVAIEKKVILKLNLLEAANTLEDLRVPPGNRLEALKGDRQGQHSIRINDQYRLCFIWRDGGADEVEITDYH
jgi:toxin HigB-1